MQLGYTMLCEQTAPKQLVSDLVRAEEIGFDFSVTSDHYFPWLEEQGHSPELGPYLDAVRGYAAAGFTHVALVQIGAERQHEFFEFADAEPLPALRGQ